LESELFGHKKGAFTGANQDRSGRFELAHNGDLFLDEIGEMPLSAQVRLLRVIQEGEFTRIGDERTIKVKCRVIAATNKNLEEMVEQKTFREDLFHRLNVVRVETTPLRRRLEDLFDLAKLFTLQIGGANYKIDEKAIRALCNYDWPGNVRELRNTIERACISTKRRMSEVVGYEDISIHVPRGTSYRLRKIACSLPESIEDLTPKNFKDFFATAGKEYFRAAIETANGNISEIAKRIGVGRTTVFRRIEELGLKTEKKTASIRRPYQYSGQLPLGSENRSDL